MNRSTSLPFLVSIVMQRVQSQNRWQAVRWKLVEVLPEKADTLIAAESPEHYLCSGFSVELFVDETPGYFLNLSTDKPCWFVMSRLDTSDEFDEQEVAIPKAITLSYNEAARWMDAGEQVDTLELSDEIAAWLAAYTQQHYQPEVKKKRKHPSFEGGEAVAKMARAESSKESGQE